MDSLKIACPFPFVNNSSTECSNIRVVWILFSIPEAFLSYPWLSGCPKAKLLNRATSPVSQRNESLWGLYVNPAEQEYFTYICASRVSQPASGCPKQSLVQVFLRQTDVKIFSYLFGWTRWEHTNPEVACLIVGVELIACLQLAEIKGQYVLNLLIVDVCQDTTSFLNKRSVWAGMATCVYFF